MPAIFIHHCFAIALPMLFHCFANALPLLCHCFAIALPLPCLISCCCAACLTPLLLLPVWSLALSHHHPCHVRRPLYRIQVNIAWQQNINCQLVKLFLTCEPSKSLYSVQYPTIFTRICNHGKYDQSHHKREKKEEEVMLELQLSQLRLVCFPLRGHGALHLFTSSGSCLSYLSTLKKVS